MSIEYAHSTYNAASSLLVVMLTSYMMPRKNTKVDVGEHAIMGIHQYTCQHRKGLHNKSSLTLLVLSITTTPVQAQQVVANAACLYEAVVGFHMSASRRRGLALQLSNIYRLNIHLQTTS